MMLASSPDEVVNDREAYKRKELSQARLPIGGGCGGGVGGVAQKQRTYKGSGLIWVTSPCYRQSACGVSQVVANQRSSGAVRPTEDGRAGHGAQETLRAGQGVSTEGGV